MSFRVRDNSVFQGTRGRVAAEYLQNVIASENVPLRKVRRLRSRRAALSPMDALVEHLLQGGTES